MSEKFYAFNNEGDFRRTTAAVKVVEKVHSTGMQAPAHVKQDATYAKITEIIGDGKQAKGKEVFFNGASFDFSEVSTDPIIYDNDAATEDDATVFTTSNISSKTAMAVDDIVKISHYPNLSETSDWLVEESGGGGGARAFVSITSVESASAYTGNLLDSVGGSVVTEGVAIAVLGGLRNGFSVGYQNFADVSTDSGGVNTYYLDGNILQ